MTETYAKCTYAKQLESCYHSTCSKLCELTLKIFAVNNDWTLSDKAKLVKIGEIKDLMTAVRENSYALIYGYRDEYKKRLDDYIASISGNQMDKDDIFMLQSPIVMIQEEFTALAEKHKGNYLMMRALKDYADKVNKTFSDEAENKAEKTGNVYTVPSKLLSMPYKVYSFDDKRRRADNAANGFIGFISDASYNDTSKVVDSLGYGAYVAMDGFAKLDEICCE